MTTKSDSQKARKPSSLSVLRVRQADVCGLRHDRAHTPIDRDRPAVGFDHQLAKDLVEQEAVVDELRFVSSFVPG